MKLKKLVDMIVFSVIAFILLLIGSYVPLIFGKYSVYFGYSVGTILIGPVIVLMARKIYLRGILFTFYLVCGLAFLLMGMFPMFIAAVIPGIIAELIMFKKEFYLDQKMLTFSFSVAQVLYGLHSYFFLLYFGVEGIVKEFSGSFDYNSAMKIKEFYSNPLIVPMVIVREIIASSIAIFIGIKIYNKYFSQNKKESKLGS